MDAFGIPSPTRCGNDTATAQFKITVHVESNCNLNVASDLDFGRHVAINEDVRGRGLINVRCTRSTPYSIKLGSREANGQRFMTIGSARGAGKAQIPYELYQDSSYSTIWDAVKSVPSGEGNGGEQSIPVYGLVRRQAQSFPQGIYTDIVPVILEY
ncbi:MAG: spore coat U domain-containing protein [Phyllobacterium sp.]|uniref:Csu type fimbrial protein n=1 Tax=Phyllobacterium sp. TaxID=1871046 RepID=UPI0030F0E336